jgi:hypothetical protein
MEACAILSHALVIRDLFNVLPRLCGTHETPACVIPVVIVQDYEILFIALQIGLNAT